MKAEPVGPKALAYGNLPTRWVGAEFIPISAQISDLNLLPGEAPESAQCGCANASSDEIPLDPPLQRGKILT